MSKFLKIVFRYVFALFFVAAGVAHLRNAAFFTRIVPRYIPISAELAVQLSGICEIGLGLMLLVARTRRLAGWGLIALLVAVFPANIYMAMHPEMFSEMPQLGLYLRLPIQGVLIWWAYQYAKK